MFTPTQTTVLCAFATYGTATREDLLARTRYYYPALKSLINKGLVEEIHTRIIDGYVLTNEGMKCMPDILEDKWQS